MANHKSAQKRARQTITRTERNTARLSRVRTALRSFRRATQDDNREALDAAYARATRELRKAASAGVLHRNNASRRVSRLAAAHARAIAGTAAAK